MPKMEKGEQTRSNNVQLLARIAQATRDHECLAVVTVLGPDTGNVKVLMGENGEIVGGGRDLADAYLEELRRVTGSAFNLGKDTELEVVQGPEGESYTITVEVVRPKPSLVIFGGGHVGQALALMSVLAGYSVTVVDDRQAFVSRERLPDPRIELLAIPFDTAADSIRFSPSTAIVIVTRGHQYDELCLAKTIETPARYIGMIGSRRRVKAVFDRLLDSGVKPEQLKRVHAPIGLEIGARSPQEIAVAILGEIIQTFNVSKRK